MVRQASGNPFVNTICAKYAEIFFLLVIFLCLTRIFQGAAASILWVAALTTIADIVGSADIGKTLGIIGPVVSTGSFVGPMVGGLLLSSVGYWYTWLVAVAMIALDLILRLIMVDRPKSSNTAPKADTGVSNEAQANDVETGTRNTDKQSRLNADATSHGESILSNSTMSTARSPIPNAASAQFPPAIEEDTTPLLAKNTHRPSSSPTKPLSNAEYFRLIFRQRRILSSLIVEVILLSAFTSFNATAALHVQKIFHWGPREVGFLFLALTGPSVLFGPFAGWARDAVGVRWPLSVGTVLAIPLFVVIGLVGDARSPPWMQGKSGKRVYIGTLALMGVAMELATGTCMVEGARM